MKKRTRFNLTTIGIFTLIISLQSCMKYDNNLDLRYPNALVTAKTAEDNTFFLQLDNETTLLPTNVKTSPFGNKEVRALVNYEETSEDSKGYSATVHINWIDSIRTKTTAPNYGEKNDSIYGTDPVEIVNNWVTIAEDNYLTLRFRTWWGYDGKPHYVNLVTGINKDNPYEVAFYHDAQGRYYNGTYGDALVAFSLDELPDTKGETVKLKLTWNSFSGKKSTEFDYCTKKTTQGTLIKINEQYAFKSVE